MKIKFIFPKGQSHNFWDLKFSAKLSGKKYSGIPLSLPTLAGLTPRDIDVEIIDENIEPIDFNDKVDLVGISYFTAFSNRAYEIADEFKNRGIKVVLGGIHASALHGEALKHADSVIIGEAEGSWNILLEDFRNKNLKSIYYKKDEIDIATSPIPRWDLVNLDYYNFFSIQATRGCPFDCEFCSVKSFFGKNFRFKPIDNVINEVRYLQNLNKKTGIVLADDNILISKQYTKELIKALIHLGVKHWWCQSSIDIANHDDILQLMSESGCTQIFIGLESVSQESLNSMNKGRTNKASDYLSAINKIHSYGISVFGSFILGGDGDSEDIFKKTVEFITEANIAFALIGILVPFTGTRLFERFKSENRLLHENWNLYNGETVCFKPKLMTAKTLQEGHRWVLEKLYSYEALSKRLDSLWKKGVLTKQGGIINKYLDLTKVFFALKGSISSIRDINIINFLLKSLYNPHNPRFFSILSAIDFHDVVLEYLNTIGNLNDKNYS